MNRILIKDAKAQGSGQVTLAGFIYNKRLHKGLAFIDLRDVSGVMQLVFEESNEAAFNVIKDLNLESVIKVNGELKEKPSRKGQEDAPKDYEMLVSGAEMLSAADENLPIHVLQKGDAEPDIDTRLNWRFLDLRQPEHLKIFKVWTEFERGLRAYCNAKDYTQIYTPTLMSTSSETGSEVFEVKYFDKKAYLGQSPQFYKQMAMSVGLEKVFMTGPVFRAEKSFTTRHVTEFTGWDFEISYADHNDVMNEEEQMIQSGFKAIKEKVDIDIEVPTLPFPRLTLKEVKEKLRANNIKTDGEEDLNPEEERGICEIIKKETGHDFLFVTEYPVSIRAFYHMRFEDRPEITKSFDLLYRGLEITTGAQREHHIDILEKQASEKNMNLEELADYLNFFRFGCPPHAGAGIGMARIIMKMLNLSSVKEAIFLPRDVKRLTP
ncbi:MAG: aspartate--tRNA(Asn) ligase [Candidatus Falkowbacteria bacterium]